MQSEVCTLWTLYETFTGQNLCLTSYGKKEANQTSQLTWDNEGEEWVLGILVWEKGEPSIVRATAYWRA